MSAFSISRFNVIGIHEGQQGRFDNRYCVLCGLGKRLLFRFSFMVLSLRVNLFCDFRVFRGSVFSPRTLRAWREIFPFRVFPPSFRFAKIRRGRPCIPGVLFFMLSFIPYSGTEQHQKKGVLNEWAMQRNYCIFLIQETYDEKSG